MSELTLDDKMRMARKACACLFAQVPEEVARSVTDAVDAAITGYDALRQQLAEAHLEAQRTATYQAVEREHAAKRELVTARQAVWEEAAKIAEMVGKGRYTFAESGARLDIVNALRDQAKKAQP